MRIMTESHERHVRRSAQERMGDVEWQARVRRWVEESTARTGPSSQNQRSRDDPLHRCDLSRREPRSASLLTSGVRTLAHAIVLSLVRANKLRWAKGRNLRG